MKKKTLIVLLGPTGVGKTNISLRIAEHFNLPIISSDSRQFYRELKIGTATPNKEEQSRVKHHFIGSHSIFDEYNSGQYELDVLRLLEELFAKQDAALLVGGSMMYIDAVCYGIDDIPNIDNETRQHWIEIYQQHGLEYIQEELKRIDPEHYNIVDLKNYKRVLHALEICSVAGKPYSSLRTGTRKERTFNILKIGLNRPREELYEQINKRVDQMMDDGLLDEAAQFYEHRHLNTLNTVGYKELYEYMSGNWTLDFAVNMIKQDTRRYAKRQLAWFNKDKSTHWFHPGEEQAIINLIESELKTIQ